MSYVERAIDLTVRLGKGSFGEDGSDTVTLSGLRVSAQIARGGSPGMSSASIRAYGLSLSRQNQLSSLGKNQLSERVNTVTVAAGDVGGARAVVFHGTISTAWSDLRGQPDAFFYMESWAGLIDATKPVAPTSYPGAADVVVILSGLAELMGYKLENSGVNGVILSNPYFAGTAREQALSCATAANIELYFDDVNGVLAIWPKGGSRGGAIPLISPATGMVGYPSAAGNDYLAVTSLFNPNIQFGGQIQVQSDITPANGVWNVSQLSHDLESQVPDGQWFTQLEAWRLGQLAPISQ